MLLLTYLLYSYYTIFIGNVKGVSLIIPDIFCQTYFSLPLRACGRAWSCLTAMTPRYQNVLACVRIALTSLVICPV